MIGPSLNRLTMLGVCLMLAACSPPPGSDAPESSAAATSGHSVTIATVNGQAISEALLDTFAQTRLRKRAGDLNDSERAQAMEELISLKVLAARAEQQGMAESEDFVSQIELQKINLLAQSLVREYMESNPVTDDEVQARFDEQQSGGGATEYKARHILLKSREDAEEVIALLNAGGDFGELAGEKSTGPTASRGGDLGWFMLDKMVKPFGDAVAGMEIGSYSKEPVQTQFGWHVILAEDTRATPFAQVKDTLRASMQRERLDEFVDGLKAESQIDTNGS